MNAFRSGNAQKTPHATTQMTVETDRLKAEFEVLQDDLESSLARNNAMVLEVELLKLELNQIFNGSADGMWVIDTEYRIQRINRALAGMLNMAEKEILGRKCYDLLECSSRGCETCPMSHMRRGTPRFEEDARLTIPGGGSLPVIRTATPFLGIDGGLVGILVSFKDITARYNARRELEHLNQKLQRLATIDGLTQVANRRQFDQQLDMEWRRMRRHKEPLSLVLCDIDFFKRYNDTLGHQQGDTCLIEVARSLNKGIRRPSDLLARYGGEEFAAILPNTPGRGALIVAGNMQSQIRLLKTPHPDSPIAGRVTLSMGVADCFPANGDTPGELIAQADQALYQAKSLGRNQVFWADRTSN